MLTYASVHDTPPKEFQEIFTDSWRLEVSFGDYSHKLLILADADFPFSLPRIAILDGPELLEWPHLEKNGLLCIFSDIASSSPYNPKEIVQKLLSDACELIQSNHNEEITLDFRDEFLSYWGYACESKSTWLSTVAPKGPSRSIVVCNIMGTKYFGENRNSLTSWLRNRFPEQKKQKISESWLIWHDEPWLPPEYPVSSGDLLGILNREPIANLDQIAIEASIKLDILVGAQTKHGVCFAGLSNSPPRKGSRGPKKQGIDPQTKGFRKGAIPVKTQLQRAFSAGAKLDKVEVSRADTAWIHGRDQNVDHDVLSNGHVCIVGVGSLGSEVATLLAKSGVGQFTFIDGDFLNWSNLSRHSLGAEYVNCNKAIALKTELAKSLPHLNIEAFENKLSMQSTTSPQNVALSADLLISTTGHWGTSSLINEEWISAVKRPHTIVAWLEAHAFASQSIFLPGDKSFGCLQCGFTHTGKPKFEVTQWKEDQTKQIPACGGVFVPYGAIGLLNSATMVASQGIDVLLKKKQDYNHRIWVGDYQQLNSNGGDYSQEWQEWIAGDRTDKTQRSRKWRKNPKCPACQ